MEELTKARKLYTPCPHCGLPLYPQELLCPHCKTPVESRLPRLDWARAQVLEEYKQRRKHARHMELLLGSIIAFLPWFLFFIFSFCLISVIRPDVRFSLIDAHTLISYVLISSLDIILCGFPVTESAFSEAGRGIGRWIFDQGVGVGLGVLHHLLRTPDRRLYPLYYLFSLLLNLALGYFLLIPSMKTCVYEGRVFYFPSFLHESVDLSKLPAMNRFHSIFCFCYYALCLLFFIIHLYRYLTPEFVCTEDIDLRRRIVGIPTEKRYDL